MRRQVTQVGYGGPFVIRGNPIGAIVDAIRNFCFPAPMQAMNGGMGYEDLSGAGLGTYGTDTGSLGLGSGYSGGFGTNPYVPLSQQCGTGTMPDYSTGMCVPTSNVTTSNPPTTTMTMAMGCDYPSLVAFSAQAGAAYGLRDVQTLCNLQGMASACASALNPSDPLNGRYMDLSNRIGRWLKALGCNDCATCAGNKRAMAPPAPPTPPPTSPATGTSGGGTPSGSTMSGSGPFGYIAIASPGGSVPPVPTIPPATVTNPPPTTPSPNITGQLARLTRGFPPLPTLPNPMSLTEGNLGMFPSSSPMGGSFDPAAVIPRTTVIRSGRQPLRLGIRR